MSVPTIDDLRVKICYICRDEEHFEAPENPPRAWIHPCSCTLIAHEACLLHWIHSSEGASAKLAKNALKCPQCGSNYELESHNPLVLRILSKSKAAIQQAGIVAILGGAVGGVALVTGVGIWSLTKYGVYATREFLGEEMFQLQLSDDPTNWPTSAFFYLPLIPISLITAGTRRSALSSMINVVLCLTTGLRSFPRNIDSSSIVADTTKSPALWPPSPLMFSLLFFPLTRMLYKQALERISQRVMGDRPHREPRDERLIFRIRRNGNAVNEGQGGGAGVLRMFVGAGQEEQEQVQPMPGDFAAVNDAAPVPAPDAGAVAELPANAAAPAPAADDRPVLEISASVLGRRMLGALLSPTIANRMGRLLLQLSKHPYFSFLQTFLAVRPRWNLAAGYPGLAPFTYSAGNVHAHRAQLTFGHFLRAFVSGTGPWPHLDPVWWRNSVGFGLFVVLKDCVSLLHRFLAKREVETRKVKGRDFKGIDLDSLDLIPGWPYRAV